MRTLTRIALLLAVFVISPLTGFSAERTWTIAREVYSADAELVAVRGNMAYLKMDGRVEEIPLERLSAIDQQYIASLSLAPILPGPVADTAAPALNIEVSHEEMPLPGPPDAPVAELELNAPDLAPAYGGAPIQSQPQPRASYGSNRYEHTLLPQPGVAANYLAPMANPRATANPDNRRYGWPPQQGPNNQSAKSKRDNDDDERPGLLGARARRLEKQRASAARSR